MANEDFSALTLTPRAVACYTRRERCGEKDRGATPTAEPGSPTGSGFSFPGTMQPIGKRLFIDGAERPVYIDADGRQFVEDEGERVYGRWIVDDADEPIIVER